jgi:hypothetical protein
MTYMKGIVLMSSREDKVSSREWLLKHTVLVKRPFMKTLNSAWILENENDPAAEDSKQMGTRPAHDHYIWAKVHNTTATPITLVLDLGR